MRIVKSHFHYKVGISGFIKQPEKKKFKQKDVAYQKVEKKKSSLTVATAVSVSVSIWGFITFIRKCLENEIKLIDYL